MNEQFIVYISESMVTDHYRLGYLGRYLPGTRYTPQDQVHHLPRDQVHTPLGSGTPPGYFADGTHPTGMHSCNKILSNSWDFFFYLLASIRDFLNSSVLKYETERERNN